MRLGERERGERDAPLLDSHRESRTGRSKAIPEPDTADPDSGAGDDSEKLGGDSAGAAGQGQDDPSDWNRQQSRTFHRVSSLLSYWEQHGYLMRWITLTSGPDSDGADQLAYNHRRLRQTVERASLAYDADGKAHELGHIREIESLVIRTSEGPDGKGVLHLFWAWKPPKGNHSRGFHVPHKWLSEQWGRIHGPRDEHDEGDVKPLHVWIEKVGEVDYHSRQNLAHYCVSQYLGDHGEALENVSWSWSRTLGGSITDAWETVKAMTESMESAIEVWNKVLGGDGATLSSNSETVQYRKVVHPPPNLSVEVVEEVSVTPPDDWQPQGPHATHIERRTPNMPEHDLDAEGRRCPECGSRKGLHALPELHEERWGRGGWPARKVAMRCSACKRGFAEPGNGVVTVADGKVAPRWRWRQTRLREF